MLMFSGFFLGTNIAQESLPGSGGDGCEESIDSSGTIIVVTVCGRRTSLMGPAFGISCNVLADSECTFTNVK